MSFATAKAQFQDNVDRHARAQDNPALYNLSAGLLQLTQAMESEIRSLRDEVRRLRHDVQDIRR